MKNLVSANISMWKERERERGGTFSFSHAVSYAIRNHFTLPSNIPNSVHTERATFSSTLIFDIFPIVTLHSDET